MKCIILCLCLFFSLPDFSQQANEIRKHYEPLVEALHRPDRLFIYSVFSNWGEDVDYFIAINKSDTVAGYFIDRDVAFRALASRRLLEKDSLDLIIRTVLIPSFHMGRLIAFIVENKLAEMPGEFKLKKVCREEIQPDGTIVRDPVYAIEDGTYYRLTEITKANLKMAEYYEVYEGNRWCPDQKEYQLFVQLDQLMKLHFPDRVELINDLIDEFRSRKLRKLAEHF